MNNENKFTMDLMNQEINCKYVNQLPVGGGGLVADSWKAIKGAPSIPLPLSNIVALWYLILLSIMVGSGEKSLSCARPNCNN